MGNSSSKRSNLKSKPELEPYDNIPGTKRNDLNDLFKTDSYIVRILIRGDSSTGKTILFKRLLGQSIDNHKDYIPTPQIQIGSIPWKHKNTLETIHLEFWDVVDKSKDQARTKVSDGVPILDADCIDIYENANGVIFLFNPFEDRTLILPYLSYQLSKVPSNVPILVFANFIDLQQNERKVFPFQIKANFPIFHENNEMIYYSEGSLLNNVGLPIFKSFIKFCYFFDQDFVFNEKIKFNKKCIKAAINDIESRLYEKEDAMTGSNEDGKPPLDDLTLTSTSPTSTQKWSKSYENNGSDVLNDNVWT